MKKRLIAVLFAAALAAACGTPDTEDTAAVEETQQGATTQPTSEPATDSEDEDEVESEAAIEGETADVEGVRQIAFNEPFVHDAEVRFEVQKLRFMTRDAVGEEAGEDAVAFLNDDTQALISLKVVAINNSDMAIDWFPNQGQMVIGDEQIDAALFISDDVAGDNWQPDVKKEGNIHWESRKDFEELVDLGTMRLLVNAPLSTEAYEPVGADLDMTIEWQP